MAEQEHEKHTSEDLARIKRDILADTDFLDKLTDEIEERLVKRMRRRANYPRPYSPIQETK